MMTETVVNVQEAPNNNTANKPHSSGESPLGWIKINLNYFKTTPGLLKLIELILGIVCMACASPAYKDGTHFFLFVVTTSFIGTLIWVFIYLLGIREALTIPLNWVLTELLNTGICTVFYFLAFIVQFIVAAKYPVWASYIAAGVFGFLNAVVYAFATYLIHLDYKSSRTTN